LSPAPTARALWSPTCAPCRKRPATRARVHFAPSGAVQRAHPRCGRLIEDDELDAILIECEEINAGQPITFFEITTVAAFVAFARHPADLTILEVGMGGRRDTTNVAAPMVSAITPIGYDHTGFLGDKL
jgi:dihydrofolate synthase/folylpolyglutamate synthase